METEENKILSKQRERGRPDCRNEVDRILADNEKIKLKRQERIKEKEKWI